MNNGTEWSNSLKASFRSIPQNVSLARIMVAGMLTESDLLLSELEEIKVAVSEAVSNAIIHGYGNNPDCKVNIEVHTSPELLMIKICDEGVGIADIEQAMTPNYSQFEERMGLGFCFMQSFMDDVRVVSAEGEGTEITLCKRLNTVPQKKQIEQEVQGGSSGFSDVDVMEA